MDSEFTSDDAGWLRRTSVNVARDGSRSTLSYLHQGISNLDKVDLLCDDGQLRYFNSGPVGSLKRSLMTGRHWSGGSLIAVNQDNILTRDDGPRDRINQQVVACQEWHSKNDIV